jgi:hypothetical protein
MISTAGRLISAKLQKVIAGKSSFQDLLILAAFPRFG